MEYNKFSKKSLLSLSKILIAIKINIKKYYKLKQADSCFLFVVLFSISKKVIIRSK